MKYGLRIAGLVILAVIITLVGAYFGSGRAGVLSNSAGTISAPFKSAASSVVNWFENLYGYIYEYDRLVEENNSLRSEIATLQEQARDYSEAIEENAALRELLSLKEKRSDFEFETAKIVSWDTSNYSSAFTLSKGETSGLQVGDCVITEYGALVGQIIELGDTWATVRTVIDINMDVGAYVGDNRYAGVVSGEFSVMQNGQTRITYLTSGASIFEGDEVLTSGKGGLFPSGLLIGTVTAVMSEAGGQTTYGIVEPACNLSTLMQVYIITDFEISD